MISDKEKHERSIFKEFIKISDLSNYIKIETVKNCNPPKPDISFLSNNGELFYFELVRIVDEGMSRSIYDQLEFPNIFKSVKATISETKKIKFDKLYSNASIHFQFNDISKSKLYNMIPVLIDYLITIDKDYSGELKPQHLNKILRRIIIKRYGFKIQSINRTAGGSYGDPILEKIKSKFDKKYECNENTHLLAYYEIQEPLSLSIDEYGDKISEIEDFVSNNITKSSFKKIWIFDTNSKKIIYVYPK